MKRGFVFLFSALLFVSLASATFTLNDFNIKTDYNFGENISGTMNVTILNEKADSVISSEFDEITLLDLLDKNFVGYNCTTIGCSNGYTSSSSGSITKTFGLKDYEKMYGGFVLTGSNIKISKINFTLESDFEMSEKIPLAIDFFEGEEWSFNEFSETFFSDNSYGCYNPLKGSSGPVIKSATYCEMIPLLKEVGAIRVGAVVSGNENKDLQMALYEEDGGFSIGSCKFNPSLGESDCLIKSDINSAFGGGKYQVCVSAPKPTDYKIYSENSGATCGFVFTNGPGNSVKDYGIYLKTANYENFTFLDSSKLDFDSLATSADKFIDEEYGRDCIDGCILPFEILGIPQNFKISDLTIDYLDSGEDRIENDIFSLNIFVPTVDFKGLLNLDVGNFRVFSSGVYSFFYNSNKLSEKNIKVVLAPKIISVSPLVVPAGVPMKFTGIVSHVGSGEIKYFWEFGDGDKEETTENFITHSYEKIKNYNLTLKVTSDGLSNEVKFNLISQDPSFTLNETIYSQKATIKSIGKILDKFPSWYVGAVKEKINWESYSDNLEGFENEFIKISNSTSANKTFQLISLAEKIYSTELLEDLKIEDYNLFNLVGTSSEINPLVIATAEGITISSEEKYNEPIFNWQETNILSNMFSEMVSLNLNNGEKSPIIKTYFIDVTLIGDEGSLAINIPISKITFKENVGAISSGDWTVIPLKSQEKKIIQFYTTDFDDVKVFASPLLNNLVIEDLIDTSCNFNLVCEENLGEDYKTCRSDCKPTKLATIWVILSILFLLFIYTVLQIWYKRRYEGFLFGDRRQLYNLLNFVANARARGNDDSKIIKDLKTQGWSKERIDYVIKKSYGQNTGFYEIIPVEKIISYFRNRSAIKKVKASSNIATLVQGKPQQKINKF